MSSGLAKYLSYFLIGLILVGNTGLSLTTVLCQCTGKFSQSVIFPPAPCCTHKAEAKPKQAKKCCAKDAVCAAPTADEPAFSASKCCDQKTDYQHIKQAERTKVAKVHACHCHICHDLADFQVRFLPAAAYVYIAPIWLDQISQHAYNSLAPPLRQYANGRMLINNIKNYRC
jgi:hypothetical protein